MEQYWKVSFSAETYDCVNYLKWEKGETIGDEFWARHL